MLKRFFKGLNSVLPTSVDIARTYPLKPNPPYLCSILQKLSAMNTPSSFHDLNANALNGKPVAMDHYAGKVVLVVNTASKCGLTPQYEGLEALYRKYKDRGVVVLGFPCNQFGNQEPGNANDISEFCQVNYGVSFPMFEKVDVNGSNTHPVFKYLKGKLGGLFGSRVKWNFTKFLVDQNGKPVRRFSPITKPHEIEATIEKLLGNG